MKSLKRWFSSKLQTEVGKCEEADKYAYSVDLYENYAVASIEVPAFCYIQITEGKHFRTQEIQDHTGWPNLAIDFDEQGNVLGLEILVNTVLTYDERRDS